MDPGWTSAVDYLRPSALKQQSPNANPSFLYEQGRGSSCCVVPAAANANVPTILTHNMSSGAAALTKSCIVENTEP
jgi:hypothetical protein